MATQNETFSFIYDEREVNLLDSLPPIYKPIQDFRGMCNSSALELAGLYAHLCLILNDQFIETCSTDALARWEKYLGITPNGTDTEDERRFRILAKLNDAPPYTDKYLEKRLNELCGEGYWRITKEYNSYRLTIEISLDSEANTQTVLDLVRDIIPANIELVVDNYRSRHSELSTFTHTQIAAYTHDQIKYNEPLS